MAILELSDGSVLASGGPARSQLFLFSRDGGHADTPVIQLPHPIFDLVQLNDGRLFATTGGGPLLELDPVSFEVVLEYGDGLTQSLAVHPETQQIYVTSSRGVEVFDPSSNRYGISATSVWEVWRSINRVNCGEQRGRTEVM